MKQTNAAQSNSIEFSSDFTTWLETEKREAKLHQLRVLKFALLFLAVISLVLVSGEQKVVQLLLGVPGIAAP